MRRIGGKTLSRQIFAQHLGQRRIIVDQENIQAARSFPASTVACRMVLVSPNLRFPYASLMQSFPSLRRKAGIETGMTLTKPALLPALVVALAALAGCAPTSLPPAAVSLPAAYPVAGATNDPSAAVDRWWRLFDDAQMASLIENALDHAPDTRAALAVLDEARATRQQALLRYDIQGNLTGSAATGQTRIDGATTTTANTGSVVGAFWRPRNSPITPRARAWPPMWRAI
jgi:hypothetical protein